MSDSIISVLRYCENFILCTITCIIRSNHRFKLDYIFTLYLLARFDWDITNTHFFFVILKLEQYSMLNSAITHSCQVDKKAIVEHRPLLCLGMFLKIQDFFFHPEFDQDLSQNKITFSFGHALLT